MKALIVEPSRVFQRYLVSTFEKSGFETVVAISGKTAHEAVAGQMFDLVCVSLHLDDMSGIELCTQLRRKFPAWPIIMLTSDDDKSTLESSMRSGITEVFLKSNLHEFAGYVSNFADQAKSMAKLDGIVLYVEDSKTMLAFTRRVMNELGLRLEHYTHAEAAYIAYEEKDFDLVLTDVMLEGQMTGLALVRQIRKLPGYKGRVPILALTGLDDVARRLELLRAGASDYVSKPVLAEELAARVRNLVVSKQLFDRVDEQQRRLQELALTDQLTTLYNRHYLMDQAPKRISEAARHQFPLSLIVIDVDHFKKINDSHGHHVGDLVLVSVAQLLKSMCRQEDMLARFGGEEFVMLLGHCDMENGVRKAEIMRQNIEALCPEGLRVTASFGMATLRTPDEGDFKQLFLAADKAVYAAKHAGRNQVVAAAPLVPHSLGGSGDISTAVH